MITQMCKVNMIPGGMPPIIHVSQYDAGSRDLTFELYIGAMPWEVPSGAVVTIDGTKSDRKAFSVPAAASGSTVTVTVTQQMAAAAGRAECQLTVTKGENVLGSANFILDVERAALPEDADMSETDISSIETARTQTIAAMQKAQTAQTAAETAKTAAEAATSTKADKGDGLWIFTSIPSGADLNDYTACGYYRVSDNSAVSTLSNCPVSKSFTMQVSNAVGKPDSGAITGTTWRYRIQRVTDYETREYVRLVYTNGSGTVTFSTWKKMLTNDDWTALKAEITPASLGITSGSWTPTVSGMSTYNYRYGKYFKFGNIVIVSFCFWGEMAGSSSEKYKISGCPYTPTEQGSAGGGILSGYYVSEDIVFTGWDMSTDGGIYAKGQIAGTGNKWGQSAIYQKTSGGSGGAGTIMFTTSS